MSTPDRRTTVPLPPAADLARIMGTRANGVIRPLDPPAELEVGAIAWVHAFGRLRRGRVVKVGRTRVRVAFVAPSNPDVVRSANERAAYVYPDARVAESGLS